MSTQPPQSSTSSQPSQPSQNKQPQLIMISGVAGSGKTTLLTFILSEWLKEEHNRRIHHLDEYDIVLRILCRETDGPSLQEFLEQTLPNILIMFKDRLVKFLKECKVLFLIDGLDEQNESSRKLVNDILKTGKDVSGFTILCTSRPEHVVDFLAKTRNNYQQWETEMARIPDIERTNFVLKHYEYLPSHQLKDPDKLKHLMDNIGWQDHFGLPLNLLFLATLFNDDPECISYNTTQSLLYLNIHQWCVDKLQHRLAGNQHETRYARIMRERKVKRVLKVMYRVELEGLLENRLYLSDEDIMQLMECCETEKLPPDEFLAAFFSFRRYIRRRTVHEKYYAPHKGLQEFYAAMHILECIEDNPIQGAIRHFFQESLKIPSPNLTDLTKVQDLYNTRVLLLHVVSLLSHRENSPDVTALPMAIEEVVDLLVETRMRSCEKWLHVLADTGVNTTVLEHAVRRITSESVRVHDDIVPITDSTVVSAAALLPRVPCVTVHITLHRPINNMSELGAALKYHTFTDLSLYHDYQHPDAAPASDLVLRDLPRCNLQWFVGHLSAEGLQLLPEDLMFLHLAVSGDQHACSLLSALTLALSGDQDIHSSLPNLESLCIHVPVTAVTPSALTTPLPDLPVAAAAVSAARGGGGGGAAAAAAVDDDVDEYSNVYLVLSGLEKNLMDSACQVAAALQPRMRGYSRISFLSSRMEAAEWQQLLERLAAVRVRVSSVFIPMTIPMTEEEEEELSTIAMDKLGCIFGRQVDHFLWTT